jgi:hypothetical protein
VREVCCHRGEKKILLQKVKGRTRKAKEGVSLNPKR